MLKSSIQVESEGWYRVLESSQKIDIETRLDDQFSVDAYDAQSLFWSSQSEIFVDLVS